MLKLLIYFFIVFLSWNVSSFENLKKCQELQKKYAPYYQTNPFNRTDFQPIPGWKFSEELRPTLNIDPYLIFFKSKEKKIQFQKELVTGKLQKSFYNNILFKHREWKKTPTGGSASFSQFFKDKDFPIREILEAIFSENTLKLSKFYCMEDGLTNPIPIRVNFSNVSDSNMTLEVLNKEPDMAFLDMVNQDIGIGREALYYLKFDEESIYNVTMIKNIFYQLKNHLNHFNPTIGSWKRLYNSIGCNNLRNSSKSPSSFGESIPKYDFCFFLNKKTSLDYLKRNIKDSFFLAKTAGIYKDKKGRLYKRFYHYDSGNFLNRLKVKLLSKSQLIRKWNLKSTAKSDHILGPGFYVADNFYSSSQYADGKKNPTLYLIRIPVEKIDWSKINRNPIKAGDFHFILNKHEKEEILMSDFPPLKDNKIAMKCNLLNDRVSTWCNITEIKQNFDIYPLKGIESLFEGEIKLFQEKRDLVPSFVREKLNI